MSEAVSDADKIRLQVIQDAWDRGVREEDLTPDKQPAQWLKIGLKRLAEKKKLDAAALGKIDKMGGTDHPDPTLRSIG